MTDLESFRTLITERQHEGEEALVRGDVEPRLRMWSHKEPVALFAAVGPSKIGWQELEPTFRSVAARLSGGRDVTYEIMSFDVSADMAWTAGFARFTVSMDGGPLTATRSALHTCTGGRVASGRLSTNTATLSQRTRAPHRLDRATGANRLFC